MSRKEKKVRTAGESPDMEQAPSKSSAARREEGPHVFILLEHSAVGGSIQRCPSKGTELLAGSTLGLRDTVG